MPEVMRLEAVIKDMESELATTERERVKSVPTGRTLGQVWATLPPSEGRAWLRSQRITVHVFPADSDEAKRYGRWAVKFPRRPFRDW
jgi:hypothetical protein